MNQREFFKFMAASVAALAVRINTEGAEGEAVLELVEGSRNLDPGLGLRDEVDYWVDGSGEWRKIEFVDPYGPNCKCWVPSDFETGSIVYGETSPRWQLDPPPATGDEIIIPPDGWGWAFDDATVYYGIMLGAPTEEHIDLALGAAGLSGGPVRVEMPCGWATTFKDGVPRMMDFYCPCGNENHVVVKWSVGDGTLPWEVRFT